jgi:hypothetical protein
MGSTDGRYFDTESCREDDGYFYVPLKDEYFEKLCSDAAFGEPKGFLEEIITLLAKT